MNALIVADINIRQDADGRYCLNDLHHASGGESKHRPNYWLENQKTQELIAEVEIAGNPAIQSKQGLGTFVVKELVYAYAMWISPAFNLKVIRAYDALMSGKQVGLAISKFYDQIPRSLPEALRLAADESERADRAEAELALAAPKAQALDRVSASEGTLTITQAAKVLGVKRGKLTSRLAANGWIYRQNGSWVAYQQHIQNGRLIYKEAKYTDDNTGQEVYKPYCHITQKGLAKLAQDLQGDAA